jgi:hypothetical protein
VVLGIAGCSVVTFWHWDSVVLLGFSSSESIGTWLSGQDSSVWGTDLLHCISSANEGWISNVGTSEPSMCNSCFPVWGNVSYIGSGWCRISRFKR